MPGATLPNISIILPAVGGDSGIWDDELNAALTLIDAHDHTSGKGLRIVPTAMNLDADVPFGGYTASSVGKLSFTAVTALTSGSKNLFVSAANNELYWRSDRGVNVRLTNGSSLDTSGVAGIVGDYTSAGAAVAYDDATDTYTFKQQSGTWARIACGGLRIAQFNTDESQSVTLYPATALGASYDVTLPAALPVAQTILQMPASGATAFANTGVTSITMATDANVTTSGTGDYKHGDRILEVSIGDALFSMAAEPGTGTLTENLAGDDVYHTLADNGVDTFRVYIPIVGLTTGDRLKSVTVYGSSASEPVIDVIFQSNNLGFPFTLDAYTNTIVADGKTTANIQSPTALNNASLQLRFIKISCAPATADFILYGAFATYDRP